MTCHKARTGNNIQHLVFLSYCCYHRMRHIDLFYSLLFLSPQKNLKLFCKQISVGFKSVRAIHKVDLVSRLFDILKMFKFLVTNPWFFDFISLTKGIENYLLVIPKKSIVLKIHILSMRVMIFNLACFSGEMASWCCLSTL